MALDTGRNFIDLVESYHSEPDSFVFFVGAGLSQPLFPSWSNLLKELLSAANEQGFAHDIDELNGYIDSGDNYLEIADTCVSSIPDSHYRDLMETVFDKTFSKSEIPEAYQLLIDLQPKTIITTNYDRIPDQASDGTYRVTTNKNAAEATRIHAQNKKLVFKLHGDINEHSSIVLTGSDYQNIINLNPATRNFITSLLSTKKFIFLGFSLTDPHLNLVLEYLKSINSNIPISHYVLLNETSKFKQSNFSTKFGVKIIPYSPEAPSHPEVSELLRALNCSVNNESIVPTQSQDEIITSKSDLFDYMEEKLSKLLLGSMYSVFINNKQLLISITSIGETTSEFQKEILSLIRLIDFKCDFIDSISISTYKNTQISLAIDNFQPLILRADIEFDIANKFAKKSITTTTVWENISFYTPPSLSDVFHIGERSKFPINPSIVGE
ncbi:SIR2 family protein [Vibrio sp. YMD68]|uniref:SIR2 family protein n=1 Tax=Vibrio sp. YMD68 TaxID=3042300 RepID=UPI00249C3F09|nr:SIR2 family protein [Vibrio sp. YMD68]WGW00004.1 SIR2 family protein [Vibrio sp. YMD68]